MISRSDSEEEGRREYLRVDVNSPLAPQLAKLSQAETKIKLHFVSIITVRRNAVDRPREVKTEAAALDSKAAASCLPPLAVSLELRDAFHFRADIHRLALMLENMPASITSLIFSDSSFVGSRSFEALSRLFKAITATALTSLTFREDFFRLKDEDFVKLFDILSSTIEIHFDNPRYKRLLIDTRKQAENILRTIEPFKSDGSKAILFVTMSFFGETAIAGGRPAESKEPVVVGDKQQAFRYLR